MGSAAKFNLRVTALSSGLAFIGGVGLPSSASAQVLPQVAPPTREQVEQKPPEQTQLPPSRLHVEGEIERAPCALDRPEYQNIRFTPTDVSFADLKGLAPADLRAAYEGYLGKDQPVSVICEIRDRAATILRDAGYIASVEVPPQRIADGHIQFQVLMAKLVGVRVRGDAGHAEKLIASYLERLTQEEVFNRYHAERYLLLAGDLPGYSVRLALRPAERARGEVIGEVTILRTPLVIDANIQNFGSQEIGRWGGMVRAQLFGLTGLGDRTSISAYSTADFDEQQTVQLAHELRIGGEGLSLAGQFTYSWTHPSIGDPRFDLHSRTAFASLEAAYPFIRSQAVTLRGAFGFDYVDQDVRINDLLFTQDHVRVAYARADFQAVDMNFTDRRYNLAEPKWRLAGTIEARQGIDIFDASRDCRANPLQCVSDGNIPPSRLGDPTATVFRSALAGEFRPMPHFTLAVSGRAQQASSPLLTFEQFSAGNYTVGRGYDPGAIVGDRGLGLQGEIRVGSVYPKGPKDLAAEPFVFVDQAWTWDEQRLVTGSRQQELTSVGGGVRATLGDQFRLEATLASPLDRVRSDRKRDTRLLFSLSTRLLPWSLR